MLIRKDGFNQAPTVKIGPIGSSDIELSVCYLPQQIIGEPKLARSANDQFWIGKIRRIQLFGNGRLINIFRR